MLIDGTGILEKCQLVRLIGARRPRPTPFRHLVPLCMGKDVPLPLSELSLQKSRRFGVNVDLRSLATIDYGEDSFGQETQYYMLGEVTLGLREMTERRFGR